MNENKDSSVRLYMRELAKSKLLSAQEERELAKRISEGDSQAREQMILSNLRLVVKIAKRYCSYGVPMVDLISEGNIGLLRAVEKFDYRKGVRFSTYSSFWISQSIRRAVANQGRTVRLPIHVINQLSDIREAENSLFQKLGHQPDESILAAEAGVSLKKLNFLRRSAQSLVSLDSPAGEGDRMTVSEMIQDDQQDHPVEIIGREDEGEKVENLLSRLDEREYEIVTLRYGLRGKRKTLEDLSQMLGVSRERVRQIQLRAIKKLRELAGSRDLLMPT